MTASTGSPEKNVASPPTAERITVTLIPKAAGELQRLTVETGLSKTDIVNRAITLYEFFNAQLQAGKDLIIRDPETRESQLIRLL